MANDFKNAHKQNVTTITDVYEAPAGKTSIVLEMDVANTTNTLTTVSVQVTDADNSDTQTYLVRNAPLPTGGTLQVVSGQKVILEAGDKIQVTAAGAVDVVAAVLEDVNT
jgi:hypothetical protein|tara:strand:- start:3218 stop:3547 length:330 start_codon:yes stop_codon:yes gene_type:complete